MLKLGLPADAYVVFRFSIPPGDSVCRYIKLLLSPLLGFRARLDFADEESGWAHVVRRFSPGGIGDEGLMTDDAN